MKGSVFKNGMRDDSRVSTHARGAIRKPEHDAIESLCPAAAKQGADKADLFSGTAFHDFAMASCDSLLGAIARGVAGRSVGDGSSAPRGRTNQSRDASSGRGTFCTYRSDSRC